MRTLKRRQSRAVFPPVGKSHFSATFNVSGPSSDRARLHDVLKMLSIALRKAGCVTTLEYECDHTSEIQKVSFEEKMPPMANLARLGVLFPEDQLQSICNLIRRLAMDQPADLATRSLVQIADLLDSPELKEAIDSCSSR